MCCNTRFVVQQSGAFGFMQGVVLSVPLAFFVTIFDMQSETETAIADADVCEQWVGIMENAERFRLDFLMLRSKRVDNNEHKITDSPDAFKCESFEMLMGDYIRKYGNVDLEKMIFHTALREMKKMIDQKATGDYLDRLKKDWIKFLGYCKSNNLKIGIVVDSMFPKLTRSWLEENLFKSYQLQKSDFSLVISSEVGRCKPDFRLY
jgi:hypothetical protein